MRKFTESQAISILTSNGAEIRGKAIIVKNGVKGLTACAALDYLKNNCGYVVNL
jgi:hypothetical protein